MRLIAAGQLMAMSLIMTVTPSITVFTTALVAGRGGVGSETYGISKREGDGGLGGAVARGLAGRDHEKKNTNLLERDDNSGCTSLGLSADYTACDQGLPANFCCNTKAGFTCQAFNHNQSAICCPPGVDCAVFSQIPCNPQGLNVSSSQGASATLHSTQVLGGLIICSDLCCPQGYACAADGSKTCVLNSSGNSTSVTASTPSTTGPIATLSNAPSASGLGPGQMTNSGGTSDSSHCAAYPSTAVLVGFFPGMAAGILGAVAALMCCSAGNRKRSQQQQHLQLDRGQQKGGNSSTRSSSRGSTDRAGAGNRPPLPHGPVSEPIFHDTGATRVDFLRRKSGRAARSSPKSPLSHGSAAVRSLFSGSTAGAHSPSSPQTPRAGGAGSGRESSTEVITVFSPPDAAFADPTAGARGSASTAAGAVGAAGATRDTRFDDMVGAARGQGLGFKNIAAPPAFMGSPSLVDGRRRALDGSTNIRG